MHEAMVEKARSRFGQMYADGAFKPLARYVSDRSAQEDRLQDAVCQVFEADSRYAARGKLLDPALVVHATKLRVIDPSRRFVKTGSQQAKDPLYQGNYSSGRVEVLHFDGLPSEDNGEFPEEPDRAIESGLAVEMSANPTARLNSALDLLNWLDGLSDLDRELLSLRFEGFTLMETAATVGVSTSTAFHRLRDLGRALAERAGLVITKKPRKPRAVQQTPSRES